MLYTIDNKGYPIPLKTSVKNYVVTANAASQKLITANPKRVAIVFSSDAANDYYINFSEQHSVLSGIKIPFATKSFELTIGKYGDAIKGELWIIAGALTTIPVCEFSAQ